MAGMNRLGFYLAVSAVSYAKRLLIRPIRLIRFLVERFHLAAIFDTLPPVIFTSPASPA
jgi:hypothetical protein